MFLQNIEIRSRMHSAEDHKTNVPKSLPKIVMLPPAAGREADSPVMDGVS